MRNDAFTRAAAAWLTPVDDVATALRDLPAGETLQLTSDSSVRDVALTEAIRAGHKFAMRDLAAGLRIRKYGEFIGRTTAAIRAGAWVHEHNLASSARTRETLGILAAHESPPADLRALGDIRTHVGENPLFDAATGCLYWIDVRETPAIHRIDLASGDAREWRLGEDIGSIALAGDGRLLAGLRSGFAFFDVATGKFSAIVDPESALPHNRMNDGKCDVAGRFWCGSMNPESGTADGSLYVLDAELRCRHVLSDLVTPNGLAWNAAGDTFFLADTRRGFIDAFDYDVRTATIGGRRVFADLGGLPGGPDGATVDAADHLWSAQFDGGCLIRYHPAGHIDRVVRLPVTRPTSCAFGGDDHRQLFVTTATRGLTAEQLRAQPLAGRVLVLDVGVAGVPANAFAQRGAA